MKVEIWSDFICPFCYVGKRNFETALSRYSRKDGVDVQWRSFQLMPELPRDYPGDIHDLLAKRYGRDRAWAVRLHEEVTATAKEAGLDYRFDRAVPTNTFDAHRFSHWAASKGLQEEAEERIFRAYFTEGKHIGDRSTLVALGEEIGLDKAETTKTLEAGLFRDPVQADMDEAQALGVNGVPFFVFDGRYAVSGAQPVAVFLGALQKASGA